MNDVCKYSFEFDICLINCARELIDFTKAFDT